MEIEEIILKNESCNEEEHRFIHLYKKKNKWYTFGISAELLNELTHQVYGGEYLFPKFNVVLPFASISEENLLHISRKVDIENKLPHYKVIVRRG